LTTLRINLAQGDSSANYNLYLIYSYGFDKLRLHRIEGIVETENSNCKKALARLGFLHEGTMKECEIKSGRFISLEIYAKLKKA
jgi:ribosomal-protein-alanine N-acetyltransferase